MSAVWGGALGTITRLLKWAMYATWTLAVLIVLFWTAFGFLIELETEWIGDRYVDDASAINARGDKVIAETKEGGPQPLPAKTVIKLKRAHQWFSTTLLEAESKDYLIGLKWRGDDRLVLILDFGCSAQMTAPVQSVGPIQIVYRFDRKVILPDHGYSSFPRDGPRQPCQ